MKSFFALILHRGAEIKSKIEKHPSRLTNLKKKKREIQEFQEK